MEELKHSGLGISSFVVSLISAILMFIVVGIAGVLESTSPGGMDENSVQAGIVGLFVFAFGLTSLLAFGLGVSGLFQANRKKVFAVLGVIISALTIVGTVGLIIVGLAMSA